MLAVAEARAKGLQIVANSLSMRDGKDAAALSIAEQYVLAFNRLAKTSNTLILPSNVGDVSSLVTQAMSIYKHVLPSAQQRDQFSTSTDYTTRPVESIESRRSADEMFEYFSDKEEAEKHRSSEPHTSKML